MELFLNYKTQPFLLSRAEGSGDDLPIKIKQKCTLIFEDLELFLASHRDLGLGLVCSLSPKILLFALHIPIDVT